MDLIQHTQSGPRPAPADPGFAERRTMRRAACTVDITVRQRGCFAVAGETADLTPYGARLAGAGPFERDSEVWLRLPGLESQTVRVVWSRGATTGVAFDQPLHAAVFARFLPSEGRLSVVDWPPAAPMTAPTGVARLAWRERIERGLGAGPESRPSEHRCEERFAETLRTGPMRVTISSYPAQVRDVSSSGLKIAATLEVEVGARVAVEFEGFEAMAGVIVWRRDDEIGLSLPPESLDLVDA